MPTFKTFKFLFLISILLINIFAISSIAATINASNASYSDVKSAIASASDGDIVIVPPGSAIWNNILIITKSITLKGNGIDKTIIKSGMDDNTFLVVYRPSKPERDEYFRLTGFTFDGNQHSIANFTFSIADIIPCIPS